MRDVPEKYESLHALSSNHGVVLWLYRCW